jgi:cellulose synthase/poly-beta-1,6-N-acetylglucosamine synthase-like glycosyltransferase
VVCLQARLNYYNAGENLLTSLFALEYATLFDATLPGLETLGIPIPLGGTSNHIALRKLQELGEWDPYNVTEDADLGLRLAASRCRTAMLDSYTLEEAPVTAPAWLRQRSRWVKGYMQTWLVHMRHPIQLLLSLGINAFASFHLTVGGTPLVFLLNPVYWTITSLWFLQKWDVIPPLFPGPVYVLSAINLIVGSFIFIYLNLAGSYRRGYHELTRFALLSPLYWFLMSLAAWKAMWQLVTKPYYWEKTIHGLAAKRRWRPFLDPIHARKSAATDNEQQAN